MNINFIQKNTTSICRVCLSISKNLVFLNSQTDELTEKNESLTIKTMLETVTNTKLTIQRDLPAHVCSVCVSYLKITFNFLEQFKKTQKTLSGVLDENFIEEIQEEKQLEQQQPASVELICGNNRFPLTDILVVEEEKPQTHSFNGFLNNLGSEISARYVNPSAPPKRPQETGDTIVTIVPIGQAEETQIVDETEVKTLFECYRCKLLLETQNELRVHLQTCSRQYVCEQCGYIANSHSAFFHHNQKHKGRQYKCTLCPKTYVTNSQLKVHLDVHKNERKHLCSQCGKGFNYQSGLRYHMRLHTNEKNYVCNYCGERFKMAFTLKRHIRTHTKDKPYQCKYCLRGFASCGEKNKHEGIHEGKRPHKCEYCGKGFNSKWNRRLHYLSHSGPHECGKCDKTFIEVQFLKQHLKNAHAENVDEL